MNRCQKTIKHPDRLPTQIRIPLETAMNTRLPGNADEEEASTSTQSKVGRSGLIGDQIEGTQMHLGLKDLQANTMQC